MQCTRRAWLNNFWRLQDGVEKALRFQSAARTAEAVHLDLQARAAAGRCVSWSGLAAVAACEVAMSVGKKVPRRAATDRSAHCSTSQIRMDVFLAILLANVEIEETTQPRAPPCANMKQRTVSAENAPVCCKCCKLCNARIASVSIISGACKTASRRRCASKCGADS